MRSTEKLFTLKNPAPNEILLTVRTVDGDRYGVFADEALIAIHESQAGAEAYCQQLIQKQSQGFFSTQ